MEEPDSTTSVPDLDQPSKPKEERPKMTESDKAVWKDTMGVLDYIAIVLVAAKAFGFCDISWAQALAPLWLPWAIIGWLGGLASVCTWFGTVLGWMVWASFTFFLITLFAH